MEFDEIQKVSLAGLSHQRILEKTGHFNLTAELRPQQPGVLQTELSGQSLALNMTNLTTPLAVTTPKVELT